MERGGCCIGLKGSTSRLLWVPTRCVGRQLALIDAAQQISDRYRTTHVVVPVHKRQSVDECMRKCQVGEERLSRAYYTLITTVRNPIAMHACAQVRIRYQRTPAGSKTGHFSGVCLSTCYLVLLGG